VRQGDVDWTKFQLFDGREIGIAADVKKSDDVAREFLLKKEGRGNSSPIKMFRSKSMEYR
jgi:hypothetical protein